MVSLNILNFPIMEFQRLCKQIFLAFLFCFVAGLLTVLLLLFLVLGFVVVIIVIVCSGGKV